MSLTYGSYVVAVPRVHRIDGAPALGGHLLVVHAELRMEANNEERQKRLGQYEFRCTGGRLEALISGNQLFLSRLFPARGERVLTARPTFYEEQLDLVAPVSRAQLAALEELRAGGAVMLTVHVEGVFHAPIGPQTATDGVQWRVSTSDWLDLLRDCRYQESLLIEVPLPGPDGSSQLLKAAAHIREAEQALGRGRWRECVGACRDVLEALSLEAGDPDIADGAWDAVYKSQKELDLAARMRVVRRSLKLLTHPARHVDEVTARIEWQAEDAKFALAVVAAAVRRYSTGKP